MRRLGKLVALATSIVVVTSGWTTAAADERADAAGKRTYARFAGISQFLPSEIAFGAHSSVAEMQWEFWLVKRAQGTGLLQYNPCKPSCAEGTIIPTPATVVMTGRTKCGRRHIFKRLKVFFTNPESGQGDNYKVPHFCPKRR